MQYENCVTVYIYMYANMKRMCPQGSHHNGFVANHALGHMMYVRLHIAGTNKP